MSPANGSVDPEAPQEPEEYLQIPTEDQIYFGQLIAGVADSYVNNWLLEDDSGAGLRADLGDPEFGYASGKQPSHTNEDPNAGSDESSPETPASAAWPYPRLRRVIGDPS